jgi:hypothetical protein
MSTLQQYSTAPVRSCAVMCCYAVVCRCAVVCCYAVGAAAAVGARQQYAVTLLDAHGNVALQQDAVAALAAVISSSAFAQPTDAWQQVLLGAWAPYSVSHSVATDGSAVVTFSANVSGSYEVHR